MKIKKLFIPEKIFQLSQVRKIFFPVCIFIFVSNCGMHCTVKNYGMNHWCKYFFMRSIVIVLGPGYVWLGLLESDHEGSVSS